MDRQVCRTCFRSHPEEQYRCSACGRHFDCPTQTVPYLLANGKELRAHIVERDRRGGPDMTASDACGPVVRMIAPRDATERPTLRDVSA